MPQEFYSGAYSTALIDERAIINLAANRLLLLLKRRVELHVTRREIELSHELARFFRAVFAVHAAIFPFDGERAVVADFVERADDLFEVHAAATRRAEVPAAAQVAEI